MTIPATFESERAIQRLLVLVNRDMAEVVGRQVLAQERLDDHKEGVQNIGGRQRKKAAEIVRAAPEQIEVLESAYSTLTEALATAQNGRG